MGREEPIFTVLPEDLINNFLHVESENALLWNIIYPLTEQGIRMGTFWSFQPLAGSLLENLNRTQVLEPYFWGYDLQGERLPRLDEVLEAVDGPGPKTEVDLYLLGEEDLVLVEAKRAGLPGRCTRYGNHACPEIKLMDTHPCTYWEGSEQTFSDVFLFGPRPEPGVVKPPCADHYQLARTVLVGLALAKRLEVQLHIWLVLPRKRWRSIQPIWADFTERIVDDELWRRMRVLAWEDIVP